jgi:hypothetical protein
MSLNTSLMAAPIVRPDAAGAAAAPPLRSDAMQSADFERLLAQAQHEQSNIEMVNPADSMAKQSIGGVTGAISSTSKEYLQTVAAGQASLAKMDLKSPASIANVVNHFTAVAAQSVQLTVMLGEVSNSKKSVHELFHNQG